MTRNRSTRTRLALLALLVLGGLAAAPQHAEAHFVLEEPPAWMSQDSLGLPQKLGPCGDEYDETSSATPTGTVTSVQEGQKITVTIHEVIFHPGHYRISLAKSRAELPVEPIVTAAATPCGSVPIQSPPVFPVLADGVFVHTAPFTAPQSIEITLPAGVTCPKCTLQVIEFMADHPLNVPGGCFYHHCADLAIQSSTTTEGGLKEAGAPPKVDSGATMRGADSGSGTGSAVVRVDASKPDASTGSVASTTSGCGCRLGPMRTSSGSAGALAIGAAALVIRRRRRRLADYRRTST